jgi:hypothetical protein
MATFILADGREAEPGGRLHLPAWTALAAPPALADIRTAYFHIGVIHLTKILWEQSNLKEKILFCFLKKSLLELFFFLDVYCVFPPPGWYFLLVVPGLWEVFIRSLVTPLVAQLLVARIPSLAAHQPKQRRYSGSSFSQRPPLKDDIQSLLLNGDQQCHEHAIRDIKNFFENSQRYSQLKVHHHCRWHWRQMEKIFIRKGLIILFGNLWVVKLTYRYFFLEVHFKV